MADHHVRVRFAPSPTGTMHLGNIRAALINYLFAKQKKGSFIVRIEDTDPQRNVDPSGKHILADLVWLGLTYDEGPEKGGPYAPYLQSERSQLYAQHLNALFDKQFVYRCFCTQEELERKKQRQIALKMPPRYDRHCLTLAIPEIEQLLASGTPYVWRFKLPNIEIAVPDLARGVIHYNLKNFSDFPLTRQDGSFTFVFANFVDDLVMKITHIFRGEEHISSTALQAAMYQAFDLPIPIFWHFPIICNTEGKKLSKRDFGFSLEDLKKEGFLPEAIINYLAIIGGSFTHEIMPLDELVHAIDFEKNASAGFIRYDVEKLRWVNHKWILLLPLHHLAPLFHKILEKAYPAAAEMNLLDIAKVIHPIREELVTLNDCIPALRFYFQEPEIDMVAIKEHHFEQYHQLLHRLINEYTATVTSEECFALMKLLCKEANLPLKNFLTLIRIALTGKAQGIGITALLEILTHDEIIKRLEQFLHKIA